MKALTPTEELIKTAAKEEFISMGFAGARMQRIAQNANINSALLHYYFRSKENLFEIIFSETINNIFETVNRVLQEPNKNIISKIEQIVNDYFDFICESPKLPMFVLMEFSYNPERIKSISSELNTLQSFKYFSQQVESAKKEGILKQTTTAQDIFTDILSLTVFQFTAEPFLATAFGYEKPDFEKFIKNRKKTIVNSIVSSIKK